LFNKKAKSQKPKAKNENAGFLAFALLIDQPNVIYRLPNRTSVLRDGSSKSDVVIQQK
jgi:hypothetical protein